MIKFTALPFPQPQPTRCIHLRREIRAGGLGAKALDPIPRDHEQSSLVQQEDSAEQAAETYYFVVQKDPGPYPLAYEAELCLQEVYYGLKLGSFYPGTVLFDQKTGLAHIVIAQQDKLMLKPFCLRIQHYAQNLRHTRRSVRIGHAVD